MKKIIIAIFCGLLTCVNLMASEVINGLIYHLDSTNYTAKLLPSGNCSYAGDIYVHSRVKFESNYYDVTKIEVGAFQNCTGLTSVAIANGVSDVGNHAFSGCTNLVSVNLPHLEFIKPYTFENCVSLRSISIPQMVKEIHSYAFTGCTGLDSIRIPSGSSLIEIYSHAFYGCTGLQKVVINTTTLVEISHGSFMNCTNLKSVSLKEGISDIGGEAFRGCTSLESFVIPNSVTAMSTRVFMGCTSLKSVVIGQGLTTLPRATFADCISIDTITIPSGITTIGDSAFTNCTGLKFITCKAVTPPTASTHSFYKDCHLYVSAAAINDYKANSKWRDFEDIRAYDYYFSDEKNPIEDEVPSADADIKEKAYTLGGNYNAGKGSSKVYPMPNKGVKIRIARTVENTPNAIEFSVNNPWKIEGISLVGTTNTIGVSSRIEKIYIDGIEYTGDFNREIPAKDAFEASYVVLDNIEARKSIVIIFESSAATQANICYSLKTELGCSIDEITYADSAKVEKICKDGTIYIVRNNEYYTLDGRRMKR